MALREKCPNTEFFLVRIFPHSDWIRIRKNSVFEHFSLSENQVIYLWPWYIYSMMYLDALVSFAVLAIIFYMYLLKLDLNLPIYLCAWSYLLLLLLLLSLLFVTLTLIRHIDWYELELEKCILLIWFFFSTILSTRNKAFQSNLIEW